VKFMPDGKEILDNRNGFTSPDAYLLTLERTKLKLPFGYVYDYCFLVCLNIVDILRKLTSARSAASLVRPGPFLFGAHVRLRRSSAWTGLRCRVYVQHVN
jgi:hypothetical protein